MSIKRFGEDLITLQQRIDTEKLVREADLNALRGEIHEALGNRNLSDEQFKVRHIVPMCVCARARAFACATHLVLMHASLPAFKAYACVRGI